MDALIAIAGVVALVWGAVLLVRGGLLGGCLALLLSGCCFGHPFYHLAAGPIPLTADRVLWVVLVGAYVVWRRVGWADPKPLDKAEIVLCLLGAWLVASAVTHDWQTRHHQPLAWLLFFYLMPIGVYWIVRQAWLSERGLGMVWASLGIFGVYLAGTAVAEVHGQWWAVFPKYIASPDELQFFGRGRGPLLNPIGSGFFQSVCLFGALMWWPRLGRPGRAILLVGLLLLGLGIYYTYTRSVWIGTAAGLMLLLGATMPRAWRWPAFGATMIVATLVVSTQWERLLVFKRDEALSARESAESVKLRPILAMVAWKMFLDSPLHGCGFGQYLDEHVNYLADRSTELPLEKARPYVQHNVVLSLLAETGLIGVGLFVALLVFWTRDAWRLWRCGAAPPWARRQALLFLAILASYLANAMFHEMSLIPMVNMLLFFVAGVTAGLRPLAIAPNLPVEAEIRTPIIGPKAIT